MLTQLPQALRILETLTDLISMAIRTAASSHNNRDIERSEAGSMQSPPEAFVQAHWAFRFAYRYGKGPRSRHNW